MMDDLRIAWRQLRRAPGFAVTAVATLALGIGATTAIFTLVDDAMLRPLPFAHADRLVTVEEKVAEWSDLYPVLPVSANHFTFWEQHSRSFAAMAAMEEYAMPLGGSGRPLQVDVLESTPGIFSVLEVQPRLGRAFTPAEAQPGRDRVAVLTYNLWREQFGADAGIVGKTVALNGYPYTVVGVMPESFHMPPAERGTGVPGKASLGALIPMAWNKDQLEEAMGDLNYFGLARLKPGVSVAAANAELNAEQQAIAASLAADEKATLSAQLTPWQQELVGTNRTPLMMLLTAVAGLLLVGCVNIANLLLARAVGQRQQLAVAAALGAGRAKILRLAMRETVVLAAVGCGLGILLASALVPLMQRYLPAALNFRGPLHLDWAGAACALGLAAFSTLLAGAAPAWMASGTAPQEVLHSESRLASESRTSRRMRRTLVSVEVAVSVALALMTGLVTVSLVRLMQVDRGFDPAQAMTARIELPRATYPDKAHRAAFYREVLGRLNALPGVERAGLTMMLPFHGTGWGDSIRLPGDTRAWSKLPEENFRWVSPGYFGAIRLRLAAGRFFSADDFGKREAVISEQAAQTLWRGRDPVGQTFHFAGRVEDGEFTVVGVVKNARTVSLAAPDPMMIYVPYWYRCDAAGALVVRTRTDPAAMAEAIRKAVWSVDASVPVPEVRTLGGIVADSVANRRFEMDLLLLFTASALLLAGLGVYGVVTYSVAQRQREIGLRIALGAQREHITRLVLREGLAPVLAGAVAGVAAAFGLARLAGSLLFGVSPYDPMLAGAAAGVLVLVGAAACWLPARRAARVEPMQALRSE